MFVRFYGLYWRKCAVDWFNGSLLGQPPGYMGSGNLPAHFDHFFVQTNFWNQQGVYILYDGDLQPVYAGQAGGKTGAGCIGDRLHRHWKAPFKHGWCYFSWFGVLPLDPSFPPNLRIASSLEMALVNRYSIGDFLQSLPPGGHNILKNHFGVTMENDLAQYFGYWLWDPPFVDVGHKEPTTKDVLSSLEAVLVEGFNPRFNKRGGEFQGSTFVEQWDPKYYSENNLNSDI